MNKENIVVTGYPSYKMIGADGLIEAEWEGPNLVVTAGKNALAAWLAATSQSSSFMPYTAIGEGAVAPLVTDTALGSEVTRLANTPSSSTNVFILAATFGPGVGTSLGLTEASLFSAAVAGDMLCRQVFAAQPKAAGSTLLVTWSITLS